MTVHRETISGQAMAFLPFLHNQRDVIVAFDFFTVPKVSCPFMPGQPSPVAQERFGSWVTI
jgi:hypothetical protein